MGWPGFDDVGDDSPPFFPHIRFGARRSLKIKGSCIKTSASSELVGCEGFANKKADDDDDEPQKLLLFLLLLVLHALNIAEMGSGFDSGFGFGFG